MKKEALIIFVKNPVLGKVKTRLAATVGDEKALSIYNELLAHTNNVTINISQDVHLFYGQFINEKDLWNNHKYQKHVQSDGDLGQKMLNAFKVCFNKGYEKVCVIGSDLMEINEVSIAKSFSTLDRHDVVIGPAKDGGYYLLGMNKLQPMFFDEKEWSSESVYKDTISDIAQLGLSYSKLDTLNDIDTEEDWNEYLSSQHKLK